MRLYRILVVGAGQMGSGIAQSAASHGFQVWLTDSDAAQRQRALSAIASRFARDVAKGRIGHDAADAALERIQEVEGISSAPPVDLAVEAVVESEPVKAEIFQALGEHYGPPVILASNTSSISISRIARAAAHPSRVIGMHFMNPVPVMKLVEVIEGAVTDPTVTEAVMGIAQAMGKSPVVVQDYPGFVSNRILMPMINEAVFALQEGVASREAIDTVMTLGMNHPMGPLTLADFIGLDTCLAIMEVLYQGFADSKYRPAPLLRKMVDGGLLGKKSGRGFYEYPV